MDCVQKSTSLTLWRGSVPNILLAENCMKRERRPKKKKIAPDLFSCWNQSCGFNEKEGDDILVFWCSLQKLFVEFWYKKCVQQCEFMTQIWCLPDWHRRLRRLGRPWSVPGMCRPNWWDLWWHRQARVPRFDRFPFLGMLAHWLNSLMCLWTMGCCGFMYLRANNDQKGRALIRHCRRGLQSDRSCTTLCSCVLSSLKMCKDVRLYGGAVWKRLKKSNKNAQSHIWTPYFLRLELTPAKSWGTVLCSSLCVISSWFPSGNESCCICIVIWWWKSCWVRESSHVILYH